MAGVTLNPQPPEAMLVMFTVKRLVHHLTVKFVKNQSGIHDVLRTHGKYGKIWYKLLEVTDRCLTDEAFLEVGQSWCHALLLPKSE
jgi:hypothetical protein